MKIKDPIPFHQPWLSQNSPQLMSRWLVEIQSQAESSIRESAKQIFGDIFGQPNALLTPSCSASLEMMPLILGMEKGDEVLVPSYTFPTSASAFVLRGVRPVYVDVDLETMCISLEDCRKKITPRTKAVLMVHYGGWSSPMDEFQKFCRENSLFLLEDAAQCIGANWGDKALGTFGELGAVSFHTTKNIHCFEGGALFVNNENYMHVAECVQEKGTNRLGYLRGEAPFYNWTHLGSSYVLSEMSAAFLHEQLKDWKEVKKTRREIWYHYENNLADVALGKGIRVPQLNGSCNHNAHIYYLAFPNAEMSLKFRSFLAEAGVQALSHYVPLHLSEYGRQFYDGQSLSNTESWAAHIVRLPIYPQMQLRKDEIVEQVLQFMEQI